ncbi:membrane protein YczE [Microbacterium sp. NPDC055521]
MISSRRTRMPRRITQLLVGVFLYGIGIAFLVRSALGAAPWDVLTQGVTRHVPLSFGIVTTIVSGIVLLLWIPIRQKPGAGTVINALLVGPSADVGFLFIPVGEQLWQQALLFTIGLLVLSAATGLYIGAHFGPGPRDGLMTGLHVRLRRPIWLVRTCLEVTVVLIGWALGGVVGIGTLLFALLVGPLCQFFLRVFAVPLTPQTGAASSTGPVTVQG